MILNAALDFSRGGEEARRRGEHRSFALNQRYRRITHLVNVDFWFNLLSSPRLRVSA